MKLRILAAALAVAATASLSACTVNVGSSGSSAGTGTDAGVSQKEDVASDVTDYAAQIVKLASVENDLLARYDAVTGKNYIDDRTVYNALQTLGPDVNSYIAQLDAVQPKTATLQAIHAKYVKAWNLYSQAFQLEMSALENQDRAQIAQANDLLAQARALVIEWQNNVKALG